MPIFRLGRSAAWAMLVLCSPVLAAGLRDGDAIEQSLLLAHNRERHKVGAPSLRWSAELASGARQWAEHLARTGRFEHSPDPPGAKPIGENIWGGTPGRFQAEAMVGLWIAEKRHFRTGVFPANSRTGDIRDVAHYTQVIWFTTSQVGCALASGRAEEILVCRYSAPGNVIGRTPI